MKLSCGLYLDPHSRALHAGWPTLRLSIDLCLEVVPQSGKGPNNAPPPAHVLGPQWVFFFQNWIFPPLWLNYLPTQVRLLWSSLNVTTSGLECEPSFGLCSRLGLIQPEDKTPPRWQWLPQGSSTPASCSSTFPGCCAEGVSIPQTALVSVYLWVHAHISTSVLDKLTPQGREKSSGWRTSFLRVNLHRTVWSQTGPLTLWTSTEPQLVLFISGS